jgi:hypothetical protein
MIGRITFGRLGWIAQSNMNVGCRLQLLAKKTKEGLMKIESKKMPQRNRFKNGTDTPSLSLLPSP